jgi:two-component system, cell cycle sensor histidine kinase and response regulator CckA
MAVTLEAHRAIVDRLPLVSYLVRLAAPSQAVFVSPQIESLFGFSGDDFAAADFWKRRIRPEDLPLFLAAFDELRTNHGRMSVEYRVNATDGRELWVRDVGVVDRADDGELYVHGYLIDVTREKELERELAAERAQAEAFFNDSPVGMGITDGQGVYLRVNDALARLTDVAASDHLGHTLADLAPEIAAQAAPLFERVRETGEAIYQQAIELERGGEQNAYLVSYFPIEGEGEERYGRIVVDTTKQRRAEERYRHLIEQLPLVTYMNTLAPERQCVFVSPQIESMYGYPAARWHGDPELWDQVVHHDDLAEVNAREHAAREDGVAFEHEYRIRRADGTIRWVLDLMDTVRDEAGNPLFEQGFIVDVTARKENENLFRAVFDSAFEAMLISNDEGRVVDANPAACELFGRTRDELLTLSRDVVEQNEIVRPDGTVRETEFAARADVLPGMHISVLRDVTERNQLQADLWRAQRLDSVGRLAGGVAHDFNNLLTSIRGYAQLLLARVGPGSVEHRHAEEIDRAADRAAALTAQLLAFGRRQVLQARPTELNRLVENLDTMLSGLAGDDLQLAFDLDPSVHAVRVDPAQIEQLLVNLVANAADATPAGGRVVIRTANANVVDLDDLPEGRYAVLSVEDCGAGIDESALEHLFEPFFTTKDVGRGVGLGLATAYGIAKQSGGTIDVATTPGVGSAFTVYLPVASAPRPAAELSAATGGETIVVVESDPAVRDVLFEVLSEAGYRAITAPTPTEAKRLAERLDGPIDLVLTELDDRRAAALAESLGAGQALTLQKPYSPDRLRRALRHALDR